MQKMRWSITQGRSLRESVECESTRECGKIIIGITLITILTTLTTIIITIIIMSRHVQSGWEGVQPRQINRGTWRSSRIRGWSSVHPHFHQPNPFARQTTHSPSKLDHPTTRSNQEWHFRSATSQISTKSLGTTSPPRLPIPFFLLLRHLIASQAFQAFHEPDQPHNHGSSRMSTRITLESPYAVYVRKPRNYLHRYPTPPFTLL